MRLIEARTGESQIKIEEKIFLLQNDKEQIIL